MITIVFLSVFAWLDFAILYVYRFVELFCSNLDPSAVLVMLCLLFLLSDK